MIKKLRLFKEDHPGGASGKDPIRAKINELIDAVNALQAAAEADTVEQPHWPTRDS